jgi:hypothetical protein
MAAVTGPLHSDTASGTFAKSLTFSTWKGRPYVRECVTPSNPKAAKQTGVRSMMGFLAGQWKSIGASPQASWASLATARLISNFNAFVSVALAGWQNLIMPQQTNGAARTSTPLTVTTQTLTGGAGQITVTVTPSAATAIWGIAIFRGVTGFVPNWTNCVAVLPANGASAVTWVDTPIKAGTYFYRTMVFNTDGIQGTIHAEASAAAT